MKQLYSLLLFFFLYPVTSFAQTDSNAVQQDTIKKDTVKPRPGSIVRDITRIEIQEAVIDSLRLPYPTRIADSLRLAKQEADSIQRKLEEQNVPKEILKDGEKKVFSGKEWLFYYLVLLLIIFGLLRRAFAKILL